jgi:hypothetical protein
VDEKDAGGVPKVFDKLKTTDGNRDAGVEAKLTGAVKTALPRHALFFLCNGAAQFQVGTARPCATVLVNGRLPKSAVERNPACEIYK